VVAEAIEGVDHARLAERPHPLGHRPRHHARDHGHVGAQQLGRHDHGEVGLVVVGERHDGFARGVVQARGDEIARISHIGGQTGDVGVVGLQFEAVDPVLRLVQDDEPPAQRVHGVPQELTGAPVPRDEHERLAQPRDLAGEALQRERLTERPVPQAGEQ
jgi:hypothetical protein